MLSLITIEIGEPAAAAEENFTVPPTKRTRYDKGTSFSILVRL